ncbi:phage holin family protein [Echinicola strongylocentroti]|uniref:Phage holin family protein n=1 Tax=Echinicola strongylocentroti TaxID=1795355 RepID=A0A2Z4IEN7_9BACT|nr:phage holin family protein [Echinicola strongylocentroti]AWW28948.1 phage holin family protein [Echinicola strongylocentroti]
MSKEGNNWGRILIQLIVAGLAVLITGYLLPGVYVEDFWIGVLIAVVISLLNYTIKPILIILTIPITIVTLGLFLLVINALIILFAAEIIPGFVVEGFWWALLFSFILSIINAIFGVSLLDNDR